MARERMVTRTVEMTVATFMTVDVVTAEILNVDHVIPGSFDNAGLMKYAEKNLATDTVKYVAVVSSEYREVLYGMPETMFIKLAKPMPPRGSAE